ncbi:hypothetical protein B0H14DRAFT_3775544 [Mycena olivaceomarginata]|nr:hypothetical protein B0H14DRAFT_3775544 [Mycena olivaceomarginata]
MPLPPSPAPAGGQGKAVLICITRVNEGGMVVGEMGKGMEGERERAEEGEGGWEGGSMSTTTHINTIPLPPLPASRGRRGEEATHPLPPPLRANPKPIAAPLSANPCTATGSRPASDDLDTLLLESANGSPCPSTHSHVQPHPHAHGSHSSLSQHAQSSLEWSWERGGTLDVSGGNHGGHGTPQRAGSADTRRGERGEFSLFAPSSKRGGAAAFFAPGWSWESTQDAPSFTWESWFTSERSLWTGVHAGEPRIAVPAVPPNRPGEPPCAHGPFAPVASFFAHAAPPDSRAVPLHMMFCPGVGRASEAAEGRGEQHALHGSLHPTRIRPLPGTAYSAQLSLPLPGKVSAPDFFPVAPALQTPAADARRRSEREAHRDGVGLGLGEPDARRVRQRRQRSHAQTQPISRPNSGSARSIGIGVASEFDAMHDLNGTLASLYLDRKRDQEREREREFAIGERAWSLKSPTVTFHLPTIALYSLHYFTMFSIHI